ncbi:hypothetical protein [Xenophilus sp.]|jgi:hypothetical protein|uniref:hypothetical protein n=1 Tax=Xenophilus sp. TaxID=1873499 RepID=UPI0037DCB8B6
MGFAFTDTAEGLRYDETQRSAGWRTVFGVAGTLALLGSGIFIVLLRGAGGPLDATRVGGIAASLLALAAFWTFGLFCLYIALLAPQQSIVFDRTRARMVRTLTAPLRRRLQPAMHIPFSEVSGLQVREQPGSEGPSTFTVEIGLEQARPLAIGVFDDRATAAAHLERVRAALGR